MVDRYIDRPKLTSSSCKFAVLDAFYFADIDDTIIYHLIQNIRKMITDQKNLMVKYLKIFQIQTIYIPRILNYYQIKK